MEEDEAQKITPDNLPPPKTTYDENDTKTVTEYHTNEEGKVVKTVRVYKVEKRQVPRVVAARKKWKKFGQAKEDGPGPNRSTTIVADEVFLQLTTNKETLDQQQEDDALKKLAATGKGMVQCRICKGDHWTTQCPYKDSLAGGGGLVDNENVSEQKSEAVSNQEPKQPTKFIIPAKRYADDSKKTGESMMRTRDDAATVRVTNLSEDATEQDLRELFSHFGSIQRIYLARDRQTQRSKGFAFINYYDKKNAEKAITALNGYGYHYLILKVEWARPQEK